MQIGDFKLEIGDILRILELRIVDGIGYSRFISIFFSNVNKYFLSPVAEGRGMNYNIKFRVIRLCFIFYHSIFPDFCLYEKSQLLV